MGLGASKTSALRAARIRPGNHRAVVLVAPASVDAVLQVRFLSDRPEVRYRVERWRVPNSGLPEVGARCLVSVDDAGELWVGQWVGEGEASGPQGPAGPAGGVLTGTYPNPTFGRETAPVNLPTLSAPWTHFAAPYGPAVYYRDGANNVTIEGLLGGSGNWASAMPICTLPSGFRPTRHLIFVVSAYGSGGPATADVRVGPDGTVTMDLVRGGTNPISWLSLTGIGFRAA